jgi:hypothetical protein
MVCFGEFIGAFGSLVYRAKSRHPIGSTLSPPTAN